MRRRGGYLHRSTGGSGDRNRAAYEGVTLAQAADWVINRELVQHNGDGGIIALDDRGEITSPFNTEGMYRGYVDGTAGRMEEAPGLSCAG